MSSNITTTPLQQSVINPSIDSVTQEGPIVQEIPVAQEMPVAQEKPVTREAPATQKQPVAQEIPTIQTAPLTSRDSVPLADPANPVNPVAPETPVIPQVTTSFTNEVPVFGGTPSLNSNNSSEFTATATTTMSETDDFSEEIQPLQKPLSTQPNQTST